MAAFPSLPPRIPVTDMVSAPWRLKLGLRAIPAETSWLEVDADWPHDLELKRTLLRDHRDQVRVATPDSRAAQREALDRVVETLRRFHPGLIRLETSGCVRTAIGDRLALDGDADPLETAARLVQEDLVVMERRDAGWCLTAGVVCFPTRWDLPSKLGLPMDRIHARVPGYREALDAPSHRFFERIEPGRVYRRGNWSLMDDARLFQPDGSLRSEPDPALGAQSAALRVWLRIEHQTLQRLPGSGAILFGIRIHRTRLDDVGRDATAARTLLEAVETMPAPTQRYKSLGAVREAVVSHLRSVLAGPSGRPGV